MNIKSQPANILLDMHTKFSKLPVLFRERVCEECNYSTPTFYRKMRGIDRRVEGKLIQALSNAEKEKIKEIAEEVTDGLSSSILGAEEK
ncbi:hypothetical protein [Chitinophaga sp. Ak27]|uniref:hypothetical protein n=1 Tax=Chitinophaga sp. Ak27 TaxID=2726116 RepID=UPI00145D162D|nr:hypothetical protein [Chitinophaga sp. Ak27]NLU93231.1 hypothetical protein [Chitinophaga sp. Ak27]